MTVVEDVTARLMDRLRAGQIDLAILAMPMRGHDVETFQLRTERLFAILPRAHRLAKKRKLQLKELRDQPFLLLREEHCFRDTAIEVCKRARVIPHIVFESGQFSSIMAMVGAGLGISIVPEMALEQRPDCSFVVVADERASRTIGVATLKGRYLSRVQRAFLSHLQSFSQNDNSGTFPALRHEVALLLCARTIRPVRNFQVLFDDAEPSHSTIPGLRLTANWDFPAPQSDRPWTYANFVQSIDGIASFKGPHAAGADISQSAEDRWLMDLLRAHADAIIMGVNTLVEETLSAPA